MHVFDIGSFGSAFYTHKSVHEWITHVDPPRYVMMVSTMVSDYIYSPDGHFAPSFLKDLNF